MSLFTDREPDFINAEGQKWWHIEQTTNYAERRGLKNHRAYIVEFTDGEKSYVVVNHDTQQVVAEDKTIDGIAIKIDVIKMLK